jgi:HEAT repeat protein
MQQPTTPAPKPQGAKPRPPEPPPEFQEGAIATMDAAGLIRILKDADSSEFQKAKACMRAGEQGDKEAVSALAALLSNERLGMYARYGLEPIADPSAGEALRAALPKLKGNLLIGVINSLGKRRDAKAAPALVRMLADPNPDVARAAAAALGSIAEPTTLKSLQAALAKATGLTKMAYADACLVFAERLMQNGKRDQAMALYTALSAPDLPKPARLAAMSGIIREETSLTRPR